jgi:hypothetical protein
MVGLLAIFVRMAGFQGPIPSASIYSALQETAQEGWLVMYEDSEHAAEVLPGKLWQAGSRVDANDSALFDAIITLGGSGQAWREEWMAAGYRTVERDLPRLPLVLHAPLIDASGWLDRATADIIVRCVLMLVRSGRRVLVHCDAGAFRSVFVAALVVKAVCNVDGATALRVVERARGRDGTREKIGPRDFDEMLTEWSEGGAP